MQSLRGCGHSASYEEIIKITLKLKTLMPCVLRYNLTVNGNARVYVKLIPGSVAITMEYMAALHEEIDNIIVQ